MAAESTPQQMPVESCVATLQAAGMALWAEGGQLRYLGVQELIDSPQFRTLRARKNEALALLQDRPDLNRRAALVERADVSLAPLSELQRRWREYQRLGGPVDNHIRVLLLKGQLNRPAFGAALKLLQERHSILRMRIGVGEAGAFQQVVAAPPPLTLHHGACSLGEIENRAADFGEPLCDEAAGEALRLLLLAINEGGFALVLCASRSALSWSALNILERDLIRIYALLDAGAPPPPVVKSLRFLDYPLWLAQRREEKPVATADWPLLRSVKAPVSPLNKTRAKAQIALPEASSLALLSRFRGRASVPSLMMTVWSLALARLHGVDRVVSSANVVDMPAVMKGVAGCFAGVAPLVADLTGRPNFEEAHSRIVAVFGNGVDAHAVAPIDDMVLSGAAATRIVVRPGGAPQAAPPDTGRMFLSRDFDSPTMVENLTAFCFLGEDSKLLVNYASEIYSSSDIRDFQKLIVKIIEDAALESPARPPLQLLEPAIQ